MSFLLKGEPESDLGGDVFFDLRSKGEPGEYRGETATRVFLNGEPGEYRGVTDFSFLPKGEEGEYLGATSLSFRVKGDRESDRGETEPLLFPAKGEPGEYLGRDLFCLLNTVARPESEYRGAVRLERNNDRRSICVYLGVTLLRLKDEKGELVVRGGLALACRCGPLAERPLSFLNNPKKPPFFSFFSVLSLLSESVINCAFADSSDSAESISTSEDINSNRFKQSIFNTPKLT